MKRLLLFLISCAFAVPAFGQGCFLKQSTASQVQQLGPFLDSSDGVTDKNSLTINASDVRLKKGSADPAAKNSGGATFKENGNYYITLDATDTATVGNLDINVQVSGALPVWRYCQVFTAAVYDAFYGSSAVGYVANAPVNVAQFGGVNGAFSGGRPEVNMTHVAGAIVNTATAQLGVNTVNFGGSAGTFAGGRPEVKVNSIANDAITAAAIQDAAIDRATFAVDTGLQPIRSNTAQAGAATTITLDASASATDNFYNNDMILITGGTGAGQARFVTAYVGSTKVATVATWVTNPGATSTFAILPFDAVAGATAPTVGEISTAVWQDLLASSDFSTASSIGKLLKDDIDAAISSRLASGGVTVTTNNDKTGYALTSAYDAAKTAAQASGVTVTTNNDKTGYALTSAYDAAKTAAQASGVTVTTNNDKTGYALSTAGNNSAADALLDRANAIETNVTLRQFARLATAALGGKTSGSGTATITFRDTNDSKNVIVCTVASGNRTACTLSLN